ncbi:MAG: TIGR03936 family radical SAM-associated protein [Dethiobacter sp.]|jgi:radical SAM-linked protein|nr:TIGR03936 family radical SAM-associated protein [Dethiobacter sp.]
MRTWINFSKELPLCFLSHLDLMRLWQRAIRRSKLPVAYSAGFNPHQKLSFASALPVGVTSSDEYLDIQFTEAVNNDGFKRLADALPSGLSIHGRQDIPDGIPPLMSLIGAASWHVSCGLNEPSELGGAVNSLLSSESLPVEREGKRGKKKLDIRPLVLNLELEKSLSGHQLSMLLQTGGDGGARPQEILALLGMAEERLMLHRTALYVRVGARLQRPAYVALIKNEVQIDAKKDYYQL